MKGNQQNKIGKRIFKIFLWFIGIVVIFNMVFMAVGTILHTTYFSNQYKKLEPYGQLVNVDDGQMHIYSVGDGEETIVLLPGMGVGLPSADFGPLMRRLSEEYTVVCVEYFGVGFSSITSKPRTSENYVEEIRSALDQAGFSAPYVLMPHSISSIYSEYYAAKYPEEVSAIISLDGTSSAFYSEMPGFVKSMLSVAKFQQSVGITSILGSVLTNKNDLLNKGYTEKEINEMIIFAGFTMNDTVLEQMANSAEFIQQTMAFPYPSSVPYFKIIASDTYETSNPDLQKMGITPQEYQEGHLERIGENVKYEILDGNHFIYLNNFDRIVEITKEFLQNTP